MDTEDAKILAHAKLNVAEHLSLLISLGTDKEGLVKSLTDPEIRHHVQTILDLEPTRRR